MTVRAVLITGVGHIMRGRKHWISSTRAAESAGAIVAFETKRKYNRPAQQSRIGRAVRGVAHFTPFNTYGRMFKRKRPPFVDVALQTRFFISQGLVDQGRTRCHSPRRRKSAVRVVTIAARHKSFIHSMFKWHGKIGSNIGMASITKLRLTLGQQEFGTRRFVNGVALRASHIILGMR